MGKYITIDHTADLAIKVSGESLKDVFITAVAAWRELVLGDSSIRKREFRRLNIEAQSVEELLVNFLSEINYFFQVRKWICQEVIQLEIVKEQDTFFLNANLSGENFTLNRHEVQSEIKAVTFHQLKIAYNGNQYSTIIVFDT